MQDEVKVITTEERELLLVEGGFKVEVSTKQSLGMKADLNIPWAKLRVIRTNSSMCIMYIGGSKYGAYPSPVSRKCVKRHYRLLVIDTKLRMSPSLSH